MNNRILTSYLFMAISIITRSQDTTYYKEYQTPSDRISATYYQIVKQDSLNPELFIAESFYMNGAKKEIKFCSDKALKNRIGIEERWYSDGKLKSHASYLNGNLNDTLVCFWENGKIKRKDIYDNGQLTSGSCFDKKGKKVLYRNYSDIARYPGGEEKLLKDFFEVVQMPNILKSVAQVTSDHSIKTQVVAKFDIDTDGSICDIEIIKSSHPDINQEVISSLSSLKKWEPALFEGEPVKSCFFYLPVNFEVR